MQCSKLFCEIFKTNVFGSLRTCECGKTYFDSSRDFDWEEGEYEELLELKKISPQKYIQVHDGGIGAIEINGIEVVIGCDCDLIERYENFIKSNQYKIAEYLKSRAKELKEEAKMISDF